MVHQDCLITDSVILEFKIFDHIFLRRIGCIFLGGYTTPQLGVEVERWYTKQSGSKGAFPWSSTEPTVNNQKPNHDICARLGSNHGYKLADLSCSSIFAPLCIET